MRGIPSFVALPTNRRIPGSRGFEKWKSCFLRCLGVRTVVEVVVVVWGEEGRGLGVGLSERVLLREEEEAFCDLDSCCSASELLSSSSSECCNVISSQENQFWFCFGGFRAFDTASRNCCVSVVCRPVLVDDGDGPGDKLNRGTSSKSYNASAWKSSVSLPISCRGVHTFRLPRTKFMRTGWPLRTALGDGFFALMGLGRP